MSIVPTVWQGLVPTASSLGPLYSRGVRKLVQGPAGRTRLLRTGHNRLSTYRLLLEHWLLQRQSVCLWRVRNRHACFGGLSRTDGIAEETHNRSGYSFNSVSSLLGGSEECEKGKPDTVSQAKTVNAVLNCAEASQRFRNRTPRGYPNYECDNQATRDAQTRL